jgi:hypothetical protein
MVDIECPIKLCIEDPVATTATLQNLLSTIDVTIDDVVAACCRSRPWKSLAAKLKVVEFFWSSRLAEGLARRLQAWRAPVLPKEKGPTRCPPLSRICLSRISFPLSLIHKHRRAAGEVYEFLPATKPRRQPMPQNSDNHIALFIRMGKRVAIPSMQNAKAFKAFHSVRRVFSSTARRLAYQLGIDPAVVLELGYPIRI